MKATTTISLEKRLLQRARQEATKNRRSLSAQIETWLAEVLPPAEDTTSQKKARKAA